MCLQVELRKKDQQLERQSERLSASQRVIAEQKEELAEVARELEATEQENSRLRESMEKMMEGNDFGRYDEIVNILLLGIKNFKFSLNHFFLSRLERDSLQPDKDVLLRKLLEAEMDSSAAAKQVSALRETVSQMSRSESVRVSKIHLSQHFWVDFFLQFETRISWKDAETDMNKKMYTFVQEKKMSGSDTTLLTRQKELLLQKLKTFESTNRALRHLLREQHSREVLLYTNS